jgi:hypothetical protein
VITSFVNYKKKREREREFMAQPHDRVYVTVGGEYDIVVYGFRFGDDPTEMLARLRERYGNTVSMEVKEPPSVGDGAAIPIKYVKAKLEFV